MHSFFNKLGRTVYEQWKRANFSLPAFPSISQEALHSQPPSESVDLKDLIKQFLLDDEQPFQTGSGFGQPELVVYDNPRFYIQVLFWLEGTTDIHQHKFSGAFHVMEGSSIHSRFEFRNAESVSAHMRVGELVVTETELLETGSTAQIISGREHIHSLFHLDTPSVSIVIRTHTDPGTGPQFTYLPPHLAIDPFHDDALTRRRKQLLDVLERTNDAAYPDLVMEMIEQLDFERGFFILQNAGDHLKSWGLWDDALDRFKGKHGRLALLAGPTLDGITRRDAIVALRHSVTDADHRFFLALLLNVPSQAAILDLVAERFEEPVITVMRWLEELSDDSDAPASILDAQFPLELSAPEDQHLKLMLETARCLLPGDSRPKKKRSSASPISERQMKAIADALRNSSLRALFS